MQLNHIIYGENKALDLTQQFLLNLGGLGEMWPLGFSPRIWRTLQQHLQGCRNVLAEKLEGLPQVAKQGGRHANLPNGALLCVLLKKNPSMSPELSACQRLTPLVFVLGPGKWPCKEVSTGSSGVMQIQDCLCNHIPANLLSPEFSIWAADKPVCQALVELW